MNDVDRAGEELVERCVFGTETTFRTEEEHRTLARWITLVSILYDLTSAGQVITPDRHHEFYKDQSPSMNR